jgi:tetratricopeptide (TPR) repeat protein
MFNVNSRTPNRLVCLRLSLMNQPTELSPVLLTSASQRYRGRARGTSLATLVLVLSGLIANTMSGPAGGLRAEEPAQEFVDQLRLAGYFDTALDYLEGASKLSAVNEEFKSSIEFQKSQVFYDLAKSSRDPAVRDDYLAKTEKSLQAFVAAGEHPRGDEARLQLGSMQLIRADQLMVGTPDEATRTKAREAYLGAANTFTEIVKKIRGELEGMKGAKLDPKKDRDQIAKRDALRADYLQGLVSSADARKMAAETFADPAKDGKSLLEQSLVDFKELGEKYSDYVQGVVAFLHAGEIQETLGMKDAAIESYMRLLEFDDVDDLRESRFRAASGLIRIAMAASPPDFKTAIEKGTPVAESIRPNENRLPAAASLRLNLAKALLAKSKDSNAGKPAELTRAKSDARSMLNEIVKVPGKHLEEAKAILSGLGVSVDEDNPVAVKAERPKDFSDALSKSQLLIQAGQELESSLAALEGKEDEESKKQRDEITKQLHENRAVAIEILRQGFTMINAETDGESVRQGRQFMAYTLYQDARYYDAVAVGVFLARSSPGTDIGLVGGQIALKSLSNLLIEDETNQGLMESLSDLDKLLVANWPNDPAASEAKSVLVQLSLKNSDWEQAQKLIGELTASAEKAALERLLGRMLYIDGVKSGQDGEADKSKTLISTAEKYLRSGLSSIEGNLVDENAVRAALTLAKIELRNNQSAAATKTLNDSKFGPVPMSEKLKIKDDAFQADLYGTELRALVGEMTSGGDANAALARAVEVMERLKASITGENAGARLTSIYMGMAKDIGEQIDAADPNSRSKLVEAFRVFLEKISQTTEDPSTLQWVGRTLLTLAESSMPSGSIKATGDSETLLKTSIETFGRVRAKGGEIPMDVHFQLGRANRLLGQYKQAIDEFSVVLKASPMALNAQFEAALAYEQWAGDSKMSPKHAGKAYEAALSGARPEGPKNQNLIWGWGKMSQLTSGNPQLRDKFFDARYHVALSRFLWGKSQGNQELMGRAIKDITQVAALYPELGGPKKKADFEKLLKQIQKELRQDPVGFAAPK